LDGLRLLVLSYLGPLIVRLGNYDRDHR